jgi:NADH-quinone oxidoreductase subunit K
MIEAYGIFAGTSIFLAVIAVYCMMVSRNLIRVLIGVELLGKVVTLLLGAGGYLNGHSAQGQSMIVTLIVVEAVLIAVAAGIVVGQWEHTRSLDARHLNELKG